MKAKAIAQRKPADVCNSGLLEAKCACGQHTVAGGKCGACSGEGEVLPPEVFEALQGAGDPLDPALRKRLEPRFHADFSSVAVRPDTTAPRPVAIGKPGDAVEGAAERLARHALIHEPEPGLRGVDLSAVRVHTGPRADAAARAVHARAFTAGNHIVFASGEFRPHSSEGRRLLTHELAHVLQQGAQPGVIRRTPAPAASVADPVKAPPPKVPDQADGAEPDSAVVKPVVPGAPAAAAPLPPGTPADSQAAVASAGAQALADQPKADADKAKEAEAAAGKVPQNISDLSTGNLAMIDEELAEHQRWGSALATVGTAESSQRATFIANQAAEGGVSGFVDGAKTGAVMGVGMKLAEKLVAKGALKLAARLGAQAAKFTPLPAVGAVIGGVMSAIDLAERDWGATGETIGRFGQGSSDYEKLANSLESISTVIEVASSILNVIAGVIGAISIAMWAITIATVGIASPLAATLSAIAAGIGLGTLALDAINALIIKRLIIVFRALHAFTSDADPEDVVHQGAAISQAAAAANGFVGGFAGAAVAGAAVDKGGKMLGPKKPATPVPPHPTPPALGGEGPTVKALPPETPVTSPSVEAPGPKPDAPKPAAPAEVKPPSDTPSTPAVEPPKAAAPPPPEVVQKPAAKPAPPAAEPPAAPKPSAPDVPDPIKASGAEPVKAPEAPKPAAAPPEPAAKPAAKPAAAPEPPAKPSAPEPAKAGAPAEGPAKAAAPEPPAAKKPAGKKPAAKKGGAGAKKSGGGGGGSKPKKKAAAPKHPIDRSKLGPHFQEILKNPDKHPRLASALEATLSPKQIEHIKTTGEVPSTVKDAKILAVADALDAGPIEIARLEEIKAKKKMAAGGGLVDPEYQNPLEAKKPALRKGERPPGEPVLTPEERKNRNRVMASQRKIARETFGKELQAALKDPGKHNNMTFATMEFMTERQKRYTMRTGMLPPDFDFHHLLTVSDHPAFAHKGSEVGLGLPKDVHKGAGHGYDTTAPVEAATLKRPDLIDPPPFNRDPEASKGYRPKKADIARGTANTPEHLGGIDKDIVISQQEHVAGLQRKLEMLEGRAKNKSYPKLLEEIEKTKKDIATQQAALEGLKKAVAKGVDPAKAAPPANPEPAGAAPSEPVPDPAAAGKADPAPAAAPPPAAAPVDTTSAPPAKPTAAEPPSSEPAPPPPSAVADAEAPPVVEKPPEPNAQPEPAQQPEPVQQQTEPSQQQPEPAQQQPEPAPQPQADSAEPVEAPKAPAPEAPKASEPGGASPGVGPLAKVSVRVKPEQDPEKKEDSAFQKNAKAFMAFQAGPKTTGEMLFNAAAGPLAGYAGVATKRGFEKARQEPVVERVNPNYAPPPCTPQDIVDVQNEILKALDARAQAEAAAAAMAKEEKHHKENEKPLDDMDKRNDDAITATEAHQQAVERRNEANEKKKAEEKKAGETTNEYAGQASKLTTVTLPMKGFARFTSRAYSLPDSPGVLVRAKSSIIKTNKDSQNFLDKLASIETAVNDQKAGQGARDQKISEDGKKIDDTNAKAGESSNSFESAKGATKDLDSQNKAKLEESTKVKTEATGAAGRLDGEAQQKKKTAQDLTTKLQAWAQAHQQARIDAIGKTQAEMVKKGWKIIEAKEK